MRPWVTADDLRTRLLQGPTATAALQALYGGPVRILRLPASSSAVPGRLGLAPGEGVAYRRVKLLAAGRAVSEAEIWYAPARLGPGMARTLCLTDLPFGEVVAPLRPMRETFEARAGDFPEDGALSDGGPAGAAAACLLQVQAPCLLQVQAPCLLQVQAMVRDAKGLVIAVVRERYLRVEDGATGLP